MATRPSTSTARSRGSSARLIAIRSGEGPDWRSEEVDVVAAYRLLLKEGRPGEIYNVSSGKTLTMSQGLEILVGGASCPITVRKDPGLCRPSDIPFMVGDNTKLRRETGWEPEWEIRDTLMGLLDAARKEFQ